MRNHCLLVFTGNQTIPGFLGGAGFRPSTVWIGLFVRAEQKAGWKGSQADPLGILEISPPSRTA